MKRAIETRSPSQSTSDSISSTHLSLSLEVINDGGQGTRQVIKHSHRSPSDVPQRIAKATLQVLVETCTTASTVLNEPRTAHPVEGSSTSPAVEVLHKDLLSLLTLIYTATTKLTLSLRADEPAFKAALGPLQDLIANVSAITTCATLFDAHGLTLASDVKQIVTEVCNALSALARTLLEEGEDHLVHTGMVHEVVDKARRELPTDNRAAVKKRWDTDRGMLEDSLQDVTSMLEDNDAANEGDEFDDDLDELDGLGLGPTKKMSPLELEHTKKVQ